MIICVCNIVKLLVYTEGVQCNKASLSPLALGALGRIIRDARFIPNFLFSNAIYLLC